jgi:hypothetical protein
MRYRFLRLRDEFQREFNYRSLDAIGHVDYSRYEMIWADDLPDMPAEAALEELFRVFNVDHPEGFRFASMSMSDVVAIDGGDSFYCDRCGWTRLTGENAVGTFQLRVTTGGGR